MLQLTFNPGPISVDIICIKNVRLTGEILSDLPFSSLPAFLDISEDFRHLVLTIGLSRKSNIFFRLALIRQ